MTPSVRLETTGPGQGIFRIAGIEAPGGTLELAIQRNLDDKYLGDGRVWQATPHWRWLPGVETDGGELTVAVGPEIIDPVAAASTTALRVFVRAGGETISGVLRTRGHLLGSPAALPPDAHAEPRAAEAPEPALELDLELLAEPPDPVPEPVSSRRRLRGPFSALLLFVGLICALGILAWQLGWLDSWLGSAPAETAQVGRTDKGQETEARLDSGVPRTAVGTATREEASEAAVASGHAPPSPDAPAAPVLTGVELARGLLEGNPDPSVLYAEAERREKSADCDAAMVLYNRAAEADPALALALARRYDPDGFRGGPCIGSADALTAAVWYEAAADAGDPPAQRRLGQLLVERETSGPVFEAGVAWLRKAARAGDPKARDLLSSLAKE
jgi:hypothetical protein